MCSAGHAILLLRAKLVFRLTFLGHSLHTFVDVELKRFESVLVLPGARVMLASWLRFGESWAAARIVVASGRSSAETSFDVSRISSPRLSYSFARRTSLTWWADALNHRLISLLNPSKDNECLASMTSMGHSGPPWRCDDEDLRFKSFGGYTLNSWYLFLVTWLLCVYLGRSWRWRYFRWHI